MGVSVVAALLLCLSLIDIMSQLRDSLVTSCKLAKPDMSITKRSTVGKNRCSEQCTDRRRTMCCRDIKLENTLLDKSKRLVKLTDFGFAKGPEDSLPKSNVGTPNYAGRRSIRTHPKAAGSHQACENAIIAYLFTAP